jgi:hypothetical protein
MTEASPGEEPGTDDRKRVVRDDHGDDYEDAVLGIKRHCLRGLR